MGRSRVHHLWIALALAGFVAISACSNDDDTASDEAAVTTQTSTFTGRSPAEIAPPPAEGKGVNAPQPAAPLPDGYVQEEFIVAGTATSFAAGDTPDDGFWTATPSEEADYRTRVIVRRPMDKADFSGTVVVEWFNVSAIEASPDWAYLADEIAREGHAYIGVSAQAQGVEGGETILDVEVDQETASSLGTDPDTSGLKNIDPVRYGSLTHPGDAYAFDIFSQVGRAASESPDQLLGDLEPTQVIAMGESQSAGFLTTLVNAVHPLEPVFDGFLIHSRGAGGPPLDGNFVSSRDRNNAEEILRRGVLIRTDLDVPVFIFESETDLTLLGYAHARQPNTDMIRTWEVAGTAHADAHFIRSIIGGPRDPSVGELLGCDEPINTGPHHEVVQAALHHLVEWTAGGQPPPEGARIELVEGDDVVIARDEHQLAIGGVRNPLVDAPVAAVTGDPWGGTSIEDLASGERGICMLFGRTIPFAQATLVELYGTADDYIAAFRASADEAVATGFLLRPDADDLISEAEANRALFG